MIRRTGEARLPRAGASLPANLTTRESPIREQTRAYEKPKLGARMSRAESEA
jgi:hypothetical protein